MDLFDRPAELASLVSDARAAAQGRPGLVVIEGAAGLGKTKLVDAFADEVRRAFPGTYVLRARCDELERDFPFGVVRQLFEPLVADWPEQDAERMFSGPAQPATHVFSSIPCVGEANALGDAPRTVLHALFRLTLRIATTAPLVLVVDDLQKADLPSLRWLRYLVRKATRSRILVVLTVRSGEEGDSLRILDPGPGYRNVRLQRFSEQQVIEVLMGRLPGRPEPELVMSCAQLTGGNPLLVQALITSISAGLDPLSGPVVTRFAGFVQAWLATVPERTREFAAALAILGSAEDGTVVGKLAGLDDSASVRAEDQLRDLGLLASCTELRWAHPLGREAVLGGLEIGWRQRAHLRAAMLLYDANADAERICAHLLNVPAPQAPWVAATLLCAARDAAIRGAPDGAARYLTRALEEQLSDQERHAAELDLGLAEAVQRPAVAWRRLTVVLDRVRDPAVQAAAAEVLADVFLREGRPADAEAVLTRISAKLASDDRELALRLDAVRLAGQVVYGIGESMLHEVDEAETALSGETPGERAVLAVLAAVATVAPGWDAERVAALAERALAPGVADLPPFAAQHAVRALALAGSAVNAARYCDEAIRHARRTRAVLGLVTLIDARSRIALQTGNLAEALKLNEEVMVNLPLEHWGRLRLIPLATRMAIFAERGEIETAGRLADDLMDASAGNVVDVRLDCAFTRAAQGRNREALALALDYAKSCPWPERSWQLLAARSHAELGETEAAQRLASQAWEHARAWGTVRAIGMALRARGEAASGQAALDLLSRSAEVLDSTETRLELAKSLLSLAAAQAGRGRSSVARRTFEAAWAEAEWCSARGIADTARAGMTAAGARPRSRAATGVDALTVGERRVADRAAAGQTNRDIAAALHLTLRTVETHLTAVYRKLGISGRAQLSGILPPP
ncbi:AAA family ATPase [Actinocrispum sp. NPDC049592]|uniref:ATP-binding protein n=1 Tax=Actinocrispum sp. NPDC049592 TaxID=3154835 RepID=UPI00342D888D